ncbi:MAG: hypothetical protein NZ694_03660 [Tepidimonas sp.]|nr:hypothetical protein [Tepidimonas sp.]
MSTILDSAAATPTRGWARGSHVEAARRAVAPRALATLLLAAGVAALAVVTDRLIDTWADGHLLAAWVLMWAVVFLGSVLLASPARHAASRVGTWLDGWAQRRALARAAARTAALTPSATSAAEAHPASPQDWAEALAPLGPALPPTARDMAAGWAWHQAELVTMPNGRRFSLFYI